MDLFCQQEPFLKAFEIKAASTYHSALSKKLNGIKNIHPKIKDAWLIYNGDSKKLSNNTGLVNFQQFAKYVL